MKYRSFFALFSLLAMILCTDMPTISKYRIYCDLRSAQDFPAKSPCMAYDLNYSC